MQGATVRHEEGKKETEIESDGTYDEDTLSLSFVTRGQRKEKAAFSSLPQPL